MASTSIGSPTWKWSAPQVSLALTCVPSPLFRCHGPASVSVINRFRDFIGYGHLDIVRFVGGKSGSSICLENDSRLALNARLHYARSFAVA